MAQTIYASFSDIEQAEKAAGALLDHGVMREDISLVAGTNDRQVQEQEVGTVLPATVAYASASGTGYPSELAVEPVTINAAGFPNPAFPFAAGVGSVDDGLYDGSQTDRYDNNAVGDGTVGDDHSNAESIAKTGITTTTPEDAGAGALKGTGVGLGLGILAGLASLVIPGVGLVVGGGALAAALGVTALTTGAGAAVGGLIGYLKDQGVAETQALKYQQTVGSGGALLALNIPSNGVDLQESELVLNKYGATDISTY